LPSAGSLAVVGAWFLCCWPFDSILDQSGPCGLLPLLLLLLLLLFRT
jgi:hypothetical protein